MQTTQRIITKVQAEQKALINGARRYESATLFTFGSVEAYATRYDKNPEEYVKRAIERKHDLAWATPEPCVVVDTKTYPGYYEARAAERAAAIKLTIGDWVELEGRVYELQTAPNDNVALIPTDRFASLREAECWVSENCSGVPVSVLYKGAPLPGRASFNPPQVDGFGRAVWEWKEVAA